MDEPFRVRAFNHMVQHAVDGVFTGSIIRLAKAVGCADKTMSDAIIALCDHGNIKRLHRDPRSKLIKFRIVDATAPSWVARRDLIWDAVALAKLRDLWAEGHSTAEIGRRLGTTKNAIVGKAHRLNLPSRPSPIRYHDPDRKAVARPAPRAVGPTLPPLPSLAEALPYAEVSEPERIPQATRERLGTILARPVHIAVAQPPASPRVVWTPPKPRPVRIAPPPPATPISAEREQIWHWAAQRGITERNVDVVNAKRFTLGLAPFAVKEWVPKRAAAGG